MIETMAKTPAFIIGNFQFSLLFMSMEYDINNKIPDIMAKIIVIIIHTGDKSLLLKKFPAP